MSKATILVGDVLQRLAEIPDGSIQTCITSPPYWGLRDYGQDDQLGLESTPQEYVANMVKVFAEVWRVLADDGTVWLNLGDSYFSTIRGSGGSNPATSPKQAIKGENNFQSFKAIRVHSGKLPLKPKDLIGIPWRVAFALQEAGWYLRQDIIWAKPNPMPESVRDRCTKSHEYVFLLSKSAKYYYDNEAIKEPSVTGSWDAMPPIGGIKQAGSNGNPTYSGNTPALEGKRNKRDVWFISTKPFKGAHFAVMPEALVEPCVLAGSQEGDTVLDPFTGSGTVAVVALKHGRNFIGAELNPDYAQIAEQRIGANLLHQVELI